MNTLDTLFLTLYVLVGLATAVEILVNTSAPDSNMFDDGFRTTAAIVLWPFVWAIRFLSIPAWCAIWLANKITTNKVTIQKLTVVPKKKARKR